MSAAYDQGRSQSPPPPPPPLPPPPPPGLPPPLPPSDFDRDSASGEPTESATVDVDPPAPIVTPSVAAAASAPPATAIRDRVVILGRRRAGKTIFLARLYEALWQGCTLVDGRVVRGNEKVAGRDVARLACRATTGAAHLQFMQTVEAMQAGGWPLATQGNTYAEMVVTYRGQEHTVTALDYPGEVFSKAFLHDSYEPDALELRAAVDRAAATVLLIDPAVVAKGVKDAHEDAFGLLQAALRIRAGTDGASVPIAIVFTKADANASFLREAGGVRAFAKKHFGQLFGNVQRTAVFASAAVGEKRNALGKASPDVSQPPVNIIEPLRYCLDTMQYVDRAVAIREERIAQAEAAARMAEEAEAAELAAASRARIGWTLFIVSVVMLFAGVTWFTLKYLV